MSITCIVLILSEFVMCHEHAMHNLTLVNVVILVIPFSKFQPVQLEQVPLIMAQLWFYSSLVPRLHFP